MIVTAWVGEVQCLKPGRATTAVNLLLLACPIPGVMTRPAPERGQGVSFAGITALPYKRATGFARVTASCGASASYLGRATLRGGTAMTANVRLFCEVEVNEVLSRFATPCFGIVRCEICREQSIGEAIP